VKSTSVIIIGAGIGGIATAAHLARRGMQVTVLEKNESPGGRCDFFARDGHRFDTGPTLFLMPLVYEAEFAALGASVHDMLDLCRVDPTYHLVFDDGSQLALTSDLDKMREQLEAIEPGSLQGFLRYLEEGDRHYRVAMERLVQRDFRTALSFFSPNNLPLLFQLKPLARHYAHMSAYFKTPRLKAAFTFQDIYLGLNPSDAPATFSMMPYTEFAHGVWYPKGGMYALVKALMNLATQAGAEFVFNAPVARIEVNGSGARGVVLADGRRLEATAVVANADLPYVYQHLLPDDGPAKRLARKQYSSSSINFYWALDKTYPALAPHTLFLADNYRENFDRISQRRALPEEPSLYIHAPTRLDPTMAPPGQDTVTAVVPVGHLDETKDQDWCQIRDQARHAVLSRLKKLGISDL
jgi:phytoene desaturase